MLCLKRYQSCGLAVERLHSCALTLSHFVLLVCCTFQAGTETPAQSPPLPQTDPVDDNLNEVVTNALGQLLGDAVVDAGEVTGWVPDDQQFASTGGARVSTSPTSAADPTTSAPAPAAPVPQGGVESGGALTGADSSAAMMAADGALQSAEEDQEEAEEEETLLPMHAAELLFHRGVWCTSGIGLARPAEGVDAPRECVGDDVVQLVAAQLGVSEEGRSATDTQPWTLSSKVSLIPHKPPTLPIRCTCSN